MDNVVEVAISHSFIKRFYDYFKMEKWNQVVKRRSESETVEEKNTISHCQVMLNT